MKPPFFLEDVVVLWSLMAVMSLVTIWICFKMFVQINYRYWRIAWISLGTACAFMFARRLLMIVHIYDTDFWVTFDRLLMPANMIVSNVGILVCVIYLWKIFRHMKVF